MGRRRTPATVSTESSGAAGYQLSRKDYNDWIEFAMGNTWYTVTTTGSPDLGVTASTKKFSRAAGSFITDGYRPGDIIRTSGFTSSDNNGDFRVTAVTATELTVLEPTGVTLVDEAEAASRTLDLVGSRIDVGTILTTILIERAFSDVNQFQVFNGCAIDQMQQSVQPEAIIGGTFNVLGMSAAALATSSISAVAPPSSSGNSPYAAFDGGIFEGSSSIAVATALEYTLSRNRSLNPVIGNRFSPDIFEGTARCQGTLSAYFENATLFNKFINETESTVWTKFLDPTSSLHFMNVVMPRVKYNGASMDPPQEGPVAMEMPFRALKATGLAKPGGVLVNSLMSIQRSD